MTINLSKVKVGDDNDSGVRSCEFRNRHNYGEWWACYECSGCGRAVLLQCIYTGTSPDFDWELPFELTHQFITYPDAFEMADEAIPDIPRQYLSEAINAISSPSASMMACASSIDAMLQDKGYKEGTLYIRIKQAVEKHLITNDMANWANEVRLDANNQRHADEGAELPIQEDAQRSIEFAKALAEYLYVLPAKVQQGRNKRNQGDQ